ncbi:MAG TPA: TetR/AcrR family transcriptional regulator [Labilithrix sp.]|nr:TetR/AcrR family transcriptional regulator [Labilithrix sp.]
MATRPAKLARVDATSLAADGRSAASSPSTAQERRRRRNDHRRRLILDAAAAEFAAHGYERTTLGGIGDRVGLSKASLYYYVDSKEELLVELVEGVRKEVEARATARAGKTADPRARLEAFVHAHVEVGSLSSAGRLLAANLDFLRTEAAAELRRRYEGSLRAILRDGIAAGQFQDIPIGPAVKLIYGALNLIPLWFDPKGPMTLDEVTDTALRMMLSGIERRASSTRKRPSQGASSVRPRRRV